jgi:hypothetical protein
MGWVPRDLWLSYLRLDAPAGDLDYDLAVSTHAGSEPSAIAAGMGTPSRLFDRTGGSPAWPIGLGVLAIGLLVTSLVAVPSVLHRRASERSA